MLQLRPRCECCDVAFPRESGEARICSFECSFCWSCAGSVLAWRWASCGGEMVDRPSRPAEKLAKYPALRERFVKLQGGGRHAA
jgi:hypothetical protein